MALAQAHETFNDDGELVIQRSDPAAIQQIVAAEVDIQVSTAKKYPRSITRALQNAMTMATLDDDTAASCTYALPRGKDENGHAKIIEGPSIRLAEIFVSAWGNTRMEARVVSQDDKFVTARGICWDLETNNAVAVDVKRRITDKNGRKFNEDMIGVTSNAANAIARRNAIFAVVPRAYVNRIYAACKKIAVGDASTLTAKRSMILESFARIGLHRGRIFHYFSVKGEDDLTLDHIGQLVGIASAIKSGEITADEAIPEIPKEPAANEAGPIGGVAATAETAKSKMKAKADTPKPNDPPSHHAWLVSEMGMDEGQVRDFDSHCASKGIKPDELVDKAKANSVGSVDALYELSEDVGLGL